MLTEDDLKRAVPANMRTAISQQLVDDFNNIAMDPLFAETVRENIISYSAVMKDGRFKLQDYLNAVMYTSYKAMGYSNQDAYIRTFPQRYNDLLARGTSQKDISAYVAAYHKGKLVNLIMEVIMVPTWILNQDVFQKAINVQAELMVNATSEKVRTDAANSLLTHLKRPETKGLDVKLTIEDNTGMTELKNTLRELAQEQQAMIQSGTSARVIANSKLIEADAIEIE